MENAILGKWERVPRLRFRCYFQMYCRILWQHTNTENNSSACFIPYTSNYPWADCSNCKLWACSL